ARREGRHPSQVSRGRRALRLRGDVEDPLDQTRAASRDLLELSSVFHWPSEADRYRGPRGAVHEEVRRADLGEPQEGGEGQEWNASGSAVICILRSIRASRCRTASARVESRPASRPLNANAFARPRLRARCSWWMASASIASRATCAGHPKSSSNCC